VHAGDEGGMLEACYYNHLSIVRELLSLQGNRAPHIQRVARPLRQLLARQLQLGAGQRLPVFPHLLRGSGIPQAILEASMKEACVNETHDWPAPAKN